MGVRMLMNSWLFLKEYKLYKDRKMEVFDGECKCVVQHYPGLNRNIFEGAGALKTEFHSDSDEGLLQQ